MKQKVAFFDIDGTVFRSSLLIELVDDLIEAGLFPESVRNDFEPAHQSWLAREGSYDDYIQSIIDAFMIHIKGVEYAAFAEIGTTIVKQKGKRVYRFTRDYIKELKKEGYALIAISQSPKTILDEFCNDYGFDKVYGRMYEVDGSGCFTGKTMDEQIIKNKANIVERVFERHPEYTREGSVAVGDTDGDISLLTSVDRPVCFNPNLSLYEHAKLKQWRVVVERKNVVYYL